ncbi:MAG: adenylate/guanylate cyclase domain-containing protein [Candidatus Binatia bacterium]
MKLTARSIWARFNAIVARRDDNIGEAHTPAVKVIGRVVSLFAQIGSGPADSDELRLRKALLVSGVCMFIVAGASWGVMYFLAGEPHAGAIPFSYAVISAASLAAFARSARYLPFAYSQLAMILFLPFFLMVSLGGFIASSGVVLWSLICPLGALLFLGPRQAPWWFGAYVGLVVLSGFLQPYMRTGNVLPPLMVTVLFVLNIDAVSTIVFVLLLYFVRATFTERERANALLLNVLPHEIVSTLKASPRTIANQFASASILFADVVNFTPLSASMPPAELVELLNELFTHFDVLVDRYGMEKIKTIGDCYMVAAGVPRPQTNHAEALIRLALDIQNAVISRTFRGRQLALRIGIDSGPVVAGVIGRRKFIYDLWGDAVNTASRMESHGTPGTIQVTRATYELIKHAFDCTPRGLIAVKGKGEMEVWWVVGPRSDGNGSRS